MSPRHFRHMLETKWNQRRFVCVGLDSDLAKIPESVRRDGIFKTLTAFNKTIVEATFDIACVYKPNTAFYEAHGAEGMAALQQTILDIHAIAPDVPVILDAKRADIGSTNQGYVQFAYDYLKADSITLHPYLGAEALSPFLSRPDKGNIILCRTSNPGSGELQNLVVDGKPLYQFVAKKVVDEWNAHHNCALVVGATYPEELRQVRAIVGDMPILIPGIGAQGGNLRKTVLAGRDRQNKGIIINSSRGILFASNGPDFAQAARTETQKLHDEISHYLEETLNE